MTRLGRGYPVSYIILPPPALSPTFNSVGTGSNSGSSSVTSLTWTQSAAAGSYVFAFVDSSYPGNQLPSGVTYGSSAMSMIADQTNYNGANYGYLSLWGLSSAPAGSQTVTVTIPSAVRATGNSVSYTNVKALGTPTYSSGSSTSLSQSATCGPGQLILQAFSLYSTATSPAGGNVRYNNGASTSGLLIQDSTSSTTFSCTESTSYEWAGIAIVI